MRLLLIANPVAGGGRARRVAERLGDRLEDRGHDVELFLTRHAGDAAARVADACEHERLIVVGGDGTLNEVLNGLADPSRVPLVHAAMGTANILAHELRLPRSVEGVARLVEAGVVRRIDMGRAGERRFLMVASAGFDARVTRELAQRKRRLGYRGYVLPILRVLRTYARPSLEVTVDGGAAVSGELAIVCNTRNYGGLFALADRACCDSGHFDVCVLRDASFLGLVHAAGRGLARRGLSRHRGTTYLTGTRVRIESTEPADVQVDGDWSGSTPLTLELTPAFVPVVVPG